MELPPDATPDDDMLSSVQRERALSTVTLFMALKVVQDCTTIATWPQLLKKLYGGNVALAATAAATTSSLCGVAELVVSPLVGTLSDQFGRRAFFFIGPVANVVVSLLQIRFQQSIPVAFLQRVASQSLSTVSGSTLCLAAISDCASGDQLSSALGSLGSFTGLGVIVGPLLTTVIMRPFAESRHVAVSFAVRAAVSAFAVLYIAVRMPETLPLSKRRPARLSTANPLNFLRLFAGGGVGGSRRTLRRLCAAIGIASLMEGKMTNDTVMLTLRENVGFSSNMVNTYLSLWGAACFASGRWFVKFLIKYFGPRRFTDFSLSMVGAGYSVLGLFHRPWAVWTNLVLISPGMANLCTVALKSEATAHATGEEVDMGKGEFAAAVSSLRAFAFVIAPTVWGRVYALLLRSGRPPSFALIAVGLVGAIVPVLIHRSVPDKQWI